MPQAPRGPHNLTPPLRPRQARPCRIPMRLSRCALRLKLLHDPKSCCSRVSRAQQPEIKAMVTVCGFFIMYSGGMILS